MTDMIDDLYKEKIEAAQNGDFEAAKWLIDDFCQTIANNRNKNNKPHNSSSGPQTKFNELLLDYLADCLNKIEKEVTSDFALNLSRKGKRGKHARKSTTEKSHIRGFRVYEAYKKISGKNDMPQVRSSSPALEQAIKQVSDAEYAAVSTIERDYKAWVKMAIRCRCSIKCCGPPKQKRGSERNNFWKL